jgi:CyaY protein
MPSMNEQDFIALAEAMLDKIEQSLESCGADIDLELKPGGVLELECTDGSKIIVNRHVAAREIWLAAKSGGFHFSHDQGRWIGTRDGDELMVVLARCLSEQTGEKVTLR